LNVRADVATVGSDSLKRTSPTSAVSVMSRAGTQPQTALLAAGLRQAL